MKSDRLYQPCVCVVLNAISQLIIYILMQSHTAMRFGVLTVRTEYNQYGEQGTEEERRPPIAVHFTPVKQSRNNVNILPGEAWQGAPFQLWCGSTPKVNMKVPKILSLRGSESRTSTPEGTWSVSRSVEATWNRLFVPVQVTSSCSIFRWCNWYYARKTCQFVACGGMVSCWRFLFLSDAMNKSVFSSRQDTKPGDESQHVPGPETREAGVWFHCGLIDSIRIDTFRRINLSHSFHVDSHMQNFDNFCTLSTRAPLRSGQRGRQPVSSSLYLLNMHDFSLQTGVKVAVYENRTGSA